VDKGPGGVELTVDGHLTWTPTKAELGAREVKILVTEGDDLQVIRWQTLVVSEEMTRLTASAVALPPGAGAGRHVLASVAYRLTWGLDGKILLLQGNGLRILDRHGLTVQRECRLDETYRCIHERPGYFVALGLKFVDLLSKDSLGLQKRIALPYDRPYDLAVHPDGKFSYVSVNRKLGGTASEPIMLVVDEAAGRVREEPLCKGGLLAMDPKGRYLFASSAGSPWPADRPWLTEPFQGDRNWYARYKCRGQELAPDMAFTETSGFSQQVRISRDGAVLGVFRTILGNSDTPATGLWRPEEAGIEAKRRLVKFTGDSGFGIRGLDFHPCLPLGVIATEKKVWLFDREDGASLEERINFEDERTSASTKT
jgi:hypothetical protein